MHISISIGILSVVIGLLLRSYKPTTMHTWYGYRSKRALASVSTFVFANMVASVIFISSGITFGVAAVLLKYFYPHTFWFDVIIATVGGLFIPLNIIMTTERLLKRFYDEEGKLKKR